MRIFTHLEVLLVKSAKVFVVDMSCQLQNWNLVYSILTI